MVTLPTLIDAWHNVLMDIFLSSTVRDYAAYRTEIENVLHKRLEAVTCKLSEDWVGGYDQTVNKCRHRVLSADGYVLLLGFWYGSRPPDCDHSITHLEFKWATGKWRNVPFPPMAVFKPKPSSEAERILQLAARQLLNDDDGWNTEEHQRLLDAFHKEAAVDAWRTVSFFSDASELREHVLIFAMTWKGQTPEAAARGLLSVSDQFVTKLSDEQLGRVGRQKQFRAIEDVLVHAGTNPFAPAVAFLVSGDERSGQKAFVSALRQVRPFKQSRPTYMGRPPQDHYDVSKLVAWIGSVLGVAGQSCPESPAELADLVAEELKHQSLYFVLDQARRLQGGVMAFHSEFWVPFFSRLSQLKAKNKFDHRLYAVVIDYTDNQAGWDESDFDQGDFDYGRLVMLPPLRAITKGQIVHWLQELEVPDSADGRLNQLAESVLTDPAGQQDGTPLLVFDRLKAEHLWS